MVYFLRKVKDVHLLFAPKREEERKIFNYQEGLRRKTSFVFKIFALQKKFSSWPSISKLNLLTIKENCEEKTSGSQSF